MDIFGISSAKIILILIIAIVLLGPDQVPTIVKTVGKTIRDFRRFVNETTKEFNEVTGDLRKEFTESVGDLRNELAATQAELKTQFDLSDVVSPITSALRDPLGAATTPTPTPEPVAVGATAAAETQAAVTETVPYTPPQPLANFTVPAPEIPPASPVEAVPEPFVVRAPRAESLAVATNGAHTGATETASDPVPLNGNGDGNGHAAFTPPRATKADAFADLVMLAPAQAVAPTVVHAVPEPPAMPAMQEPAIMPERAIDGNGSTPLEGLSAIPVVTEESPPAADTVTTMPAPRTPRPRPVGGSVAGTKYGRKRASS